MHDHKHGPKFWVGNGLMVVALAILLFMGLLWEHLGVWAMGLWAVVAGAGGYLVMADKGGSPAEPN